MKHRGDPQSTKSPFPFIADPLLAIVPPEELFQRIQNPLLELFCKKLLSFHAEKNYLSKELDLYNPLFIYGEAYTGKTCFLSSLAAALMTIGCHALYVKLETFTEHLLGALRSDGLARFREHYRKVDLLLVDDVHLLSGKTATQEEFFHTFNTLYENKKSVVLTAPYPPHKLESIEPRLTSRFEWGISLHLTAKAEKTHEQVFQKQHSRAGAAEEIIQTVARYYGIATEDILGRSHMACYAKPRQMAMYLVRILTQMPFQAIARLFFRDHSTVITNVNLIKTARELCTMPIASELVELLNDLRGRSCLP